MKEKEERLLLGLLGLRMRVVIFVVVGLALWISLLGVLVMLVQFVVVVNTGDH